MIRTYSLYNSLDEQIRRLLLTHVKQGLPELRNKSTLQCAIAPRQLRAMETTLCDITPSLPQLSQYVRTFLLFFHPYHPKTPTLAVTLFLLLCQTQFMSQLSNDCCQKECLQSQFDIKIFIFIKDSDYFPRKGTMRRGHGRYTALGYLEDHKTWITNSVFQLFYQFKTSTRFQLCVGTQLKIIIIINTYLLTKPILYFNFV